LSCEAGGKEAESSVVDPHFYFGEKKKKPRKRSVTGRKSHDEATYLNKGGKTSGEHPNPILEEKRRLM